MKLNEFKCKNCGGTLKKTSDQNYVKCEFCDTTYTVSDAYSDGYNYEKGKMKAQDERLEQNIENMNKIFKNNSINKVFLIPFLIIFFIIFSIVIYQFISINKDWSKNNNYNETLDEFEISKFNSKFEVYVGTQYGTFTKKLIDTVSINNKTNDNKVIVKYKDTETKDSEEMINIKKELDDLKKYEVKAEYNKLIYKITIEE